MLGSSQVQPDAFFFLFVDMPFRSGGPDVLCVERPGRISLAVAE